MFFDSLDEKMCFDVKVHFCGFDEKMCFSGKVRF